VSLRYDGTFRLIVHSPADGRRNMAVDEYLMEAVGRGQSPPVIRLYGFSPPTVSLGRFQRLAGCIDHARLQAEGVTLVRRPTGGQAVLHDHELTYAVVLAREHLEPYGKREVYRFIAALLVAALERLGIPSVSSRTRTGNPHNPDCFSSTGEYEISSPGGRKLIGSAQILGRQAALQHGAVPLDRSYRNIERYLRLPAPASVSAAGSLSEELGRPLSFAEAAAAFGEAARAALPISEQDLSPEEWRGVEELERSKYGTDAWNLGG
jgi:lipoate-protein ligase A